MKGPTGLVITAVTPNHSDVLGHQTYTTIRDVEKRQEKKAERERIEEGGGKVELTVREMWKPWGTSIGFFEEMEKKCVFYDRLLTRMLIVVTAQHPFTLETNSRISSTST
jgi:hypothetical protein